MKTIFVSSTFNDMQQERDALQNIVANRINGIAKQYGDYISFCDLRWGVNTVELGEEAAAEKVLNVCLDEIDRSDPPMIVLLGERYGWIPDKKTIKSITDKKAFQLDGLEELEISVTALEIEYGSLQNDNKIKNTFFYFRKSSGNLSKEYPLEDEIHQRKLQNLKERIIKLSQGHIREYTICTEEDVDSFAEMVYEDLKNKFLPEWKQLDNVTQEKKEDIVQWNFAKHCSQRFSAHEKEMNSILNFTNNKNGLCLISGPEGCGKTTLISYVACIIKDKNLFAKYIHIGLTLQTKTYYDFLCALFNCLKNELADIKEYGDNIELNIIDLLNCFSKQRKIVLFIDNIDFYGDAAEKMLFFLKKISHYSVVIVTKMEYKKITGLNVELGSINENDAKKTLKNYLKLKGRELPEIVIKKILSKSGYQEQTYYKKVKATYPIHLVLLVESLLLFNFEDYKVIDELGSNMKAICDHQVRTIDKKSSDWYAVAIDNINKVVETTNTPLLLNALKIISFTRKGLRMQDISALLGSSWNYLFFADLKNFFSEYIIVRNGNICDFAYDYLRSEFKQYTADELSDAEFLEALGVIDEKTLDFDFFDMMSYLDSLEDDDVIKINEYLYCATQCEQFEKIISYVSRVYITHNDNYIYNLAEQFFNIFFNGSSHEHCLSYEREMRKAIKNLNYSHNNTIFIEFVLQYVLKKHCYSKWLKDYYEFFVAVHMKTEEYLKISQKLSNVNNYILSTNWLTLMLVHKEMNITAVKKFENMYCTIGNDEFWKVIFENPQNFSFFINELLQCFITNRKLEIIKKTINLIESLRVTNLLDHNSGFISYYCCLINAYNHLGEKQQAVDLLYELCELCMNEYTFTVDDLYWIEKCTTKVLRANTKKDSCIPFLQFRFELLLPLLESNQYHFQLYANDAANEVEYIGKIYFETINLFLTNKCKKYYKHAILACKKLVNLCKDLCELYPVYRDKVLLAYLLFLKCIITIDDKENIKYILMILEWLLNAKHYNDYLIELSTNYVKALNYCLENDIVLITQINMHIEKLFVLLEDMFSMVEFLVENNSFIDFLDAKDLELDLQYVLTIRDVLSFLEVNSKALTIMQKNKLNSLFKKQMIILQKIEKTDADLNDQ